MPDFDTIGGPLAGKAVLRLPEGRHSAIVTDFLEANADRPNVVIQGEGSGVTFIETKVELTQWRPKISGVTIMPPDDDCLVLQGTGEAFCQDVWCHPPHQKTGIKLLIKEADRSGVQSRWPLRGEEAPSQRISLADFYSCHIVQWNDSSIHTNGWWIESDFDWAGTGFGEFLNHIKIFGGHTAVRGGDKGAFYLKEAKNIGVWGHHIDVADGSIGIHNDNDTMDNVWWYAPGAIEDGSTLNDNDQCFKGVMRRFYPVGWVPTRGSYENTTWWDEKQNLNHFEHYGANWDYKHNNNQGTALRVKSSAQLEDITDTINTMDRKIEGLMVFNSTTNKPVYAVGPTDGAGWVDATGATAHTPV